MTVAKKKTTKKIKADVDDAMIISNLKAKIAILENRASEFDSTLRATIETRDKAVATLSWIKSQTIYKMSQEIYERVCNDLSVL